MKKDLAVIFGLFFVIIVLVIFGKNYTSFNQFRLGSTPSATQSASQTTTVRVKTLSINVKIAETASERKRGLSKQDSLPLNEGMLFVFDKEGTYGIWMKDMKFAIDIIWIDKDKKIVDIAKNVPPGIGEKDSELIIYKPQSAALYVLEVNAGLASLHDIAVGDPLELVL